MNFNKIEELGKAIFSKNPQIRRIFKRAYQGLSVLISRDRFKAQGNFIRVSPENENEYFFGYYDKIPWDDNDRFMIALRVKSSTKSPAPNETGTVVILDTKNNNREIEIGKTDAWNSQQGCMAQWLGPDFKSKIIYNDFRNDKYVSVIFNVEEMKEEKVLMMPIYDVSKNGEFALTLDFSRLHRVRPGYGYSNLEDKTSKEAVPDETCMWKIDITTGEIKSLFSYKDFYSFETKENMKVASHMINHIMISPNGTRAMVLHRWRINGERFSRLVTFDCNGNKLYNLLDDEFVSHCYWKNDEEIMTFARIKKIGKAYFMLKDKTKEYKHIWPELETDGHMSYSENKQLIVTDTYPNRKRIASLFVNTDDTVNCIGRVYAPFKYDNDVRCDLHPRWNRKGTKICIDSVHEGKRAIYTTDVNTPQKEINQDEDFKIPKIIHSVWLGNGKKSSIAEKSMASWEKFCCDYKIMEWDESNFDIESSCEYVKQAYKVKKWAFVSDYVRLKALYEYGGLYFDSDFEVLKNIDDFLNNSGFVCVESKYTISTAILAAEPKAQWVKDLLDNYENLNFINNDGSYNQLPNTKILQSYLQRKYNYQWSNKEQEMEADFIVYPSEYFSPLNCFTGVMKKTSNTYGIHHYDNTWKSPKEKIKKKIMQFGTRIIGEDNRARLVSIKEKK